MKITELVVLRTYFMIFFEILKKSHLWGSGGGLKVGALDLPKSSSQKLQ